MSNRNDTSTDPRERLVRVGNDLLDAIYELEKTTAAVDELQAAKDDPTKLDSLMNDGGLEVLVQRLGALSKKDLVLREYVTIRQTIESLTGVTR